MFVKICGITSEEDALLAVAMGADAIGFVFAAGSPRLVRAEDVHDIVKALPHGEVATVGVFRDERPDRVVEIVNTIGLKAAQLHGREALSEVRYVRQRVPAVIQAFAADDPALAAAANSAADMVLVDSPTPGSGRPFDWSLVDAVTGGMRVVVAGGLTPENVDGVIRRARPFGVDVATGVETPPGSGRKDPRKVRRFVEEARAAARRLTETAPRAGNGEPVYDWAREDAR